MPRASRCNRGGHMVAPASTKPRSTHHAHQTAAKGTAKAPTKAAPVKADPKLAAELRYRQQMAATQRGAKKTDVPSKVVTEKTGDRTTVKGTDNDDIIYLRKFDPKKDKDLVPKGKK